MKILYLLDKETTNKAEVSESKLGVLPFLIPQIGSVVVMNDKAWKVAKVKYKIDQADIFASEVTVMSEEYVKLVDSTIKMKKAKKYNVTIEGDPVNNYPLTLDQAKTAKEKWEDDGFKEVEVERITTH